jgi:hypothetical protein
MSTATTAKPTASALDDLKPFGCVGEDMGSGRPGTTGGLETALKLHQEGFHVVPVNCPRKSRNGEGKDPFGKAWGKTVHTEQSLRRFWAAQPDGSLGICFGPDQLKGKYWLIDLEGDGDRAEESWIRATGGEVVETMGWTSKRGVHRLFVVDARFLDLLRSAGAAEAKGSPGVFHLDALPDLEWRVGGRQPDGSIKQLQSVCPPSVSPDGKPREWNGCWTVNRIPDAVVSHLEALAERAAIQAADAAPEEPRTIPINTNPFVATASGGKKKRVQKYVADPYIDDILIDELGKLAAHKQPGRNDQLFASGAACANYLGVGAFSESQLEAWLWDACHVNGLASEEAAQTRASIRSALDKGKLNQKPRPPQSHQSNGSPADRPWSGKRASEEAVDRETVDYAGLTDDQLGIVPLRAVKSSAIEWMWKYRIAKGELTILAGEGGLGKSQVLLSVASTISVGGEWPDKSGRAPLGSTLILAAEDSAETTIKPRLVAMGADIDRIHILRSLYEIPRPGKQPVVNLVHLQDLRHWNAVLDRLPDLKLLVIDPLASYLGRGVNDSKNNELRAVLEPFIANVVRPRGVALMVNAHLNKSVDIKNPAHRINGSVAYANLARNCHFIVRNPDDPTHRIYAQIKCNNAPDDLPAIGFKVEGRMVDSDGQQIETAVPVFDAETMTIDIREAMNQDKGAGKRGPDPAKKKELAIRIVEFMKDRGLVPVHEMFRMAGAAGYLGAEKADGRWSSPNPLYRAKDYVPELEAPHDGWEVVTSREDGTICDIKGGHRWLLRAKGSPF